MKQINFLGGKFCGYGSQPTYEELKLLLAEMTGQTGRGSQPTYEELKLKTDPALREDQRSQPTYEELKLTSSVETFLAGASFSAYL